MDINEVRERLAVLAEWAVIGRAYGDDLRALLDHHARLQGLIDGQADSAADEAITWGTQYPGKSIKLFGAREIAELNWYPDEGADLVGLRVVERVQPTKGDGE